MCPVWCFRRSQQCEILVCFWLPQIPWRSTNTLTHLIRGRNVWTEEKGKVKKSEMITKYIGSGLHFFTCPFICLSVVELSYLEDSWQLAARQQQQQQHVVASQDKSIHTSLPRKEWDSKACITLFISLYCCQDCFHHQPETEPRDWTSLPAGPELMVFCTLDSFL